MTRVAVYVLLLGCAAVGSCSSPAPSGKRTSGELYGEPAAKESTARDVIADAAPPPVPDRFAALGTKCPAAIDAGVSGKGPEWGRVLCSDSVVVGLYLPGDSFWPQALTDAQLLVSSEDRTGRGTARFVATRGGVLYVQQLTCSKCRRIIGWWFAGLVSAMTDAQLVELQGYLGLATKTTLRDESAWRDALLE